MGIFGWANERAKLFGNLLDIKLLAFTAFMLGLILAKPFPVILSLDIWWYLIIFIMISARTYYVMFFKKL
ncbi:MAG: hypothetical protein QMD53_02160 [Actinomycetota bacterium]|nr:hypothetical protein [Actinomycetota bacterium]